MATPANSLIQPTQTTTLSNGLSVATEYSPYAQTATVGVWIDAGSRADQHGASGAAHFLEHMAFKVFIDLDDAKPFREPILKPKSS
jgi:mitochondrial-processing peptidase subunit beta